MLIVAIALSVLFLTNLPFGVHFLDEALDTYAAAVA